MGRSKEEICGALSGGLIALGYLRGRNAPSEKWDQAATIAQGVRAKFIEEHGCTRCGQLLEKLGPQEDMNKCIRLAGDVAGMFHEALRATDEVPAAQCGCTARQAKPVAAESACGCGCK